MMMTELYGIDRSLITKHFNELKEDSVCAIFAHTVSGEKTYKVKFYELQAVIAIGFMMIKGLCNYVNGSSQSQKIAQ